MWYASIIIAICFIPLLVNRYYDWFLPLFRQFLLLQIEVISLWISKQIVLPSALISSAGTVTGHIFFKFSLRTRQNGHRLTERKAKDCIKWGSVNQWERKEQAWTITLIAPGEGWVEREIERESGQCSRSCIPVRGTRPPGISQTKSSDICSMAAMNALYADIYRVIHDFGT